MLGVFLILAAITSPQARADPAKEDPIVCKRSLVGSTGSRLRSSKVCMRKSDWDLQQRHTDKIVQKINDRGATAGEPYVGVSLTPQ